MNEIMKKILLFSIALCAIVSCAKQEVEPQEETTPIVFTASIDGDDSKTEVTSTGKVSWVVGDEITVSNGTHTSCYYIKEETDISGNRVATFTFKSGTNFNGKGTYYATYGDVSLQRYNPGHPGSNCPMEAEATSTTASSSKITLKFKNSCGVVAVVANTGDNVISKISLGDAALYFTSPAKLDGTYLIAIPGGASFSNVTFYKSNGSYATKTLGTATTMTKNVLRKMNTGNYFGSATYTEIPTLSGLFAISSSQNVKFSIGNLQAVYNLATSSYSWGFAEHQYDIVGGYPGNTTINKQGDGKIVDLFGFSNAMTNFGISTSQDNTLYGGDFLDWAQAIGATTEWKTLSKEDWEYLLNSRGDNSYAKANINGQRGLLLFPNGYEGEIPTTGVAKTNTSNANYPSDPMELSKWETMEKAGCVFLPSAYKRIGGEVDYGAANHYLHYWTSTISNKYQANYLYANNTYFGVSNSPRYEGKAVRLVKVVVPES